MGEVLVTANKKTGGRYRPPELSSPALPCRLCLVVSPGTKDANGGNHKRK